MFANGRFAALVSGLQGRCNIGATSVQGPWIKTNLGTDLREG